jgi:hypothetical protein
VFTVICRECGESYRSAAHPFTHDNRCLGCGVMVTDRTTSGIPPRDGRDQPAEEAVLRREFARLQKKIDGLETAVRSLFHACVLAREAVRTGAVSDKTLLLEWLERAMALGLTRGETDDLTRVPGWQGWVNLADGPDCPEIDIKPILY